MAEVDTSFYPKAQPVNPLAMAAQGVALSTAINNNKLIQQSLDLRQGTGDAVEQSTDPATGQFNHNKFLALVGHDPRTSWNFGDINQQTQGNYRASSEADVADLQKGIAHLKTANDLISGLLADPDLGRTDKTKDIISGAVSLVGNDSSMLNAQSAAKLISTIPSDPQGQRQWVLQHYQQNAALQGHLEKALPQPAAVGTGPGTKFVDLNPVTNPSAASQFVPNQLSPQELAAPATWVDPATNRTMSGTVAMKLQALGPNALSAPQAPQAPTPAQPQSPFGTGRVQPTAAKPLVGSLAPDESAALQATGAESAKGLSEASRSAAGYPTRMFQLQQALSGIQGAGETGPGTEARNSLVSYAQSLPFVGEIAKAIGVSKPEEIANYDLANKYLTQYAIQQAGQMGEGTDSKLAAAFTGNASTHISKLAATDVIRANMAIEKMRQAATMAFYSSGKPPQDYNKFISQWSGKVDPRAFAVDSMKSAEIKKMIDAMKGKERDNFAQSYNQAVQMGLVNPPGAANGGQ